MTKRGIWVAFLTIGFMVGVVLKASFNLGVEITLLTAIIGLVIGFITTKLLGICGCNIQLGETYFHIDCNKCEGNKND